MTIDPEHMPMRRGDPATRDADGSLRITAETGAVVVLNPTAAALWELLDGQTTVDELVLAATSLFSGSRDDIRQDIFSTLDVLRRESLLS